MPNPFISHVWTFGSGIDTGASTTIVNAIGLRMCRNLTYHMIVAGGTCSFGIEAGTDSTSGFARMGSTAYAMSSANQTVVQFNGPIEATRPFLIARTDSGVVARVILHGN